MLDILNRHFASLLVFRTVVAQGSMNKAAAILHLTQPAITRSIGRLEEAVGAKLLDRAAQGVAPTIFGQAILDHIAVAADEIEQAARKLKILQRAEGGAVACGAAAVSMRTLVTEAAYNFHRTHPQDGLRLLEGATPAMLAMLAAGELDVVVGSRMAQGPEPGLVVEPLVDEMLGVYARAGHGLDTDGPAKVAQLLADHYWVFPDRGTHVYDFIHAELDARDVAMPTRVIQTTSTSALRWYVEFTDYLTVSTSLVVMPELRAGTVVRVDTDWSFPATKHVLYRRTRSEMSRSALTFCAAVKRVAREWNGAGVEERSNRTPGSPVSATAPTTRVNG